MWEDNFWPTLLYLRFQFSGSIQDRNFLKINKITIFLYFDVSLKKKKKICEKITFDSPYTCLFSIFRIETFLEIFNFRECCREFWRLTRLSWTPRELISLIARVSDSAWLFVETRNVESVRMIAIFRLPWLTFWY